jgi:aspartate racemase
MAERIIGVLGGMGPEATADFLRQVVRVTPARTDQEHVRVLAYSNPRTPDRTRAILGEGRSPVPELIDAARKLESAGAGLLVMPCNTAHHFLPEVEKHVAVPFLNMVWHTAVAVRSHGGLRTVGLLATTGTIASGLYHRACADLGIAVTTLDRAGCQAVDGAIKAIKGGGDLADARASLVAAARNLIDAGAQGVILGCTELPLVVREAELPCPCFNPTRTLAETAVRWALSAEDGPRA